MYTYFTWLCIMATFHAFATYVFTGDLFALHVAGMNLGFTLAIK